MSLTVIILLVLVAVLIFGLGIYKAFFAYTDVTYYRVNGVLYSIDCNGNVIIRGDDPQTAQIIIDQAERFKAIKTVCPACNGNGCNETTN